MTNDLPEPIARYFEADRDTAFDKVLACFTDTAVVLDEGVTHRGRAAIGAWKARATRQYTYTVEPVAIASDGQREVVTGHLVGDFPGSPLDLRYAFVLDRDKIAELEIRP